MKLDNKKNKLVFILALITIITTFVPINTFASEPTPKLGPINPEFLEYINQIDSVKEDEELNNTSLQNNTSIMTFEKGIIPEPFIINRSSRTNFSNLYNEIYPDRFDLRDIGRITSVKDQGENGSCWTFAAYSSLESYLRPIETWDFSEKNMRNNHGFDYGPNDGGNRSMSTAYMARWDGPILEADDPYDEYGFYSPTDLPIQKHLTNVLYIPDRKNSLDNELIKYALMEYGAVQTSIYSNQMYYNSMTSAHYYNGLGRTDHAVSIIGWDDNYSRNNFKITPPGDGAFIVKNSWGINWGQDGYFYISYYDTNVGKSNAVYIAEDTNKYDNIYQYDPFGMTGSIGYGTGVGWFANVFQGGDKDESLNGLGFFVTEDNSSYEVFISTDYTGNLNNRRSVAKGEIKFAGYHTVEFPPEVIKSGSKFAVIVKMIGDPGSRQIPVERQINNYTSSARAQNGQSFIGPDGYNWNDVNIIYPNTNVTLKAFSVDKLYEPTIIPVESIELDKKILQLEFGTGDQLTATVNPYNATNQQIFWSSSNPEIVGVRQDGFIIGFSPGTAIITVTTEDGEKTSSCQVTVKDPKPQPDPYEGYEVWKEILTTKSENHAWTIKLSMPVDKSTVDSSTVYIIDKDNNKLSFIDADPLNDDKFGYIKLNNNGAFKMDKEYWIIIEDSIQSIKGNNLSKGLKIKFTVQ